MVRGSRKSWRDISGLKKDLEADGRIEKLGGKGAAAFGGEEAIGLVARGKKSAFSWIWGVDVTLAGGLEGRWWKLSDILGKGRCTMPTSTRVGEKGGGGTCVGRNQGGGQVLLWFCVCAEKLSELEEGGG